MWVSDGLLGLLSHDVLRGAGRKWWDLCLSAKLIRWVHQAHAWVCSEHGVVALLSVDQLQLVEFHVLGCLLDCGLLLEYLLLQVLDQLQIFRPRRPLIIQISDLDEPLVQLLVLLVHEQRRVLELRLQLTNFLGLLSDQLLHGLPQIILKFDLLLLKL